jgi:hypothetical protein
MGNEPEAELTEGVEGGGGRERSSEGPERPRVRVQAIDRQQGWLRSVVVEELVEEDHPVRAIWELSGQVDLSRYYEAIRAVEGVAGADAIDPRLLVCLWLLAYSQGVSSAREIERRCGYHPGLLSRKLCLSNSSGLLKTRLKHGIELSQSRGDAACHGSPATLLQRGDSES